MNFLLTHILTNMKLKYIKILFELAQKASSFSSVVLLKRQRKISDRIKYEIFGLHTYYTHRDTHTKMLYLERA